MPGKAGTERKQLITIGKSLLFQKKSTTALIKRDQVQTEIDFSFTVFNLVNKSVCPTETFPQRYN